MPLQWFCKNGHIMCFISNFVYFMEFVITGDEVLFLQYSHRLDVEVCKRLRAWFYKSFANNYTKLSWIFVLILIFNLIVKINK